MEVEKEIVFRSPRSGKLSSLMHFLFVRVSVDLHTEMHRHGQHWETNAHCHIFQASLLGRMFQICCRNNFPRFNQRNKPSGNKQNLCTQPQDVMHYSRRQSDKGCGRASLLLTQIITSFPNFFQLCSGDWAAMTCGKIMSQLWFDVYCNNPISNASFSAL